MFLVDRFSLSFNEGDDTRLGGKQWAERVRERNEQWMERMKNNPETKHQN